MNLKSKFKRLLSAILSFAVIGTALPSTLAVAEEVEKYPYSVFGRNGITVSASSNLCINGNIHTNKEADISYSNGNINGKITTGNDIEKRVKHVYSDQKIMETYFTENCDIHEEEYVYSDMNIHINNPLFCYNNITLNGNVSLNSNLGTYMNLNITGEVKNANTSVVYSKYGDITIENDSTANINGLIYAPLGTLTINSPNINLNGVIIADKIVINGSSVNINYKDDIAQFIGNTSEVYDFSGLEYLPEDWLGDTDEDGLFDIYEKVIDTDPLNPDTDGDGLLDGYEVITLNTDPLEIDTDGNGISDADEDFDNDNLNNLGEYQNLTEPFNPDTDDDGFLDGDEVYTYNTDPLNPDTDNDGLLDGEESYDGSMYTKYGVYFDPLNPDTNGNGILDGDEVFGQSKQQSVETYDETITDVKVDMDTNGNIERNLSIESMYNIDAMSTNVYAMIGEPFNFTSSTDFKSATITFKIDQSKLGDTLFDNLIILWYNEEDQVFEEMPTTRDAVNSTVSTTTTHFSQYMVVDSQKWYANWNNSLSELRKMWTAGTSYQRNLHTILMMDCSSSAYSSDPYSPSLKVGYNGVTSENIEDIRNSINSQWDAEYYCVKSCDRFDICDGIINNKGSNDAVALITFAGGVVSNSGWIYSKGTLRNVLAQNIGNYGGIGSWRSAISTALSMVKQDTSDIYRIVIISDTNANSGVISSNEFASNVILNVVNVGTGSFGNNIEEVAQATGGDVYNAISASDLTYQTGGIITSPEQFIGTDSDGDGIPDIVELYGLKPNGEPINTDPNKKDTDGDGIDDNVELGYIGDGLESDVTIADYVRALKVHSDPTKADTDGDGFGDKKDISPLTFEYVNGLEKLCDIAIEYMPNDFYNSQLLVLQTIRRDYYNGGFWNKTAGAVDENFISYLKENYFDIYSVFIGLEDKDRIYMKDTISSGRVDIAHWAATINAYYYDFEVNIDKIPDGYNYIISGTANMYIDNFAGWLGDYLSMLFEMNSDSLKSKEIVYDNIGQNDYFGINDVLADFDALNIYYQNKNMEYTISDAFNKYYKNLGGTSQRYGNFARNLMCENGYGFELMFSTDNNISSYKEVFDKVMNSYINQDLYVIFNGLLVFSSNYDCDDIVRLFRNKETIASTASAFTEYVFNRVSNFSDVSIF